MVIEHFRKDTHYSGLILVDRTFNINIKKNSLCFTFGSSVDLHKGGRIIRKLLTEHFNRCSFGNSLILQNIRQHFQKVRFTTSKEARDPDSNISSRGIKGIAVIIEKGREMFSQFFCYNVLFYFLFDNIVCILIDLDYAIDLTVNVIVEHILYSHGWLSFRFH